MSRPGSRASPWPLLVGAAGMVFVAMLASFTPTPLYALYRERWDVSDAWVSVAFSAYAVGVLLVLVTLGGLSDRHGRRPALVLAGVVIGVSLLTLAAAGSPAVVVVGRLLQGFGTALATGAAAAALMELHPRGVQAGAALNAVSLSAGCAIGPFLSGLVADHTARAVVAPYLVVGAVLVVPLGVLLLAPRSGPPRAARGAGTSLVRRVRVPRRIWPGFAVAGAAVVLTNTSMGLYGAFGPDLAVTVGLPGTEQAGRLVATVFVVLTVVQVASRRRRNAANIVSGSLCCAAGWLTTATAAYAGSAWLAFAGAALVGAGAGLNLLGSAALVGALSPPHMRAEVYSAYLVVAFTALGGSALLAGWGLGHLLLQTVVAVLAVAVTGLAAVTARAAHRLGRGRPGGGAVRPSA